MDLSQLQPEANEDTVLPTPDNPGVSAREQQTRETFVQLSDELAAAPVDEDGLRLDIAGPAGDARRAAIQEQKFEAVQPIIQRIAEDDSIDQLVRVNAINKVTQSVREGVDPEQLIYESLIQEEREALDSELDRQVQANTLAEIADMRSLDTVINELAADLEASHASDGVSETVTEFITANVVGFLRSAGWNINNMISYGLDIDTTAWTTNYADALKEANRKFDNLPHQEKVASLRRMFAYLEENSGIITDNRFDASEGIAAIRAIAGGRASAAFTADENRANQIFGVLTSTSFGIGVKAANRGAKGAKGLLTDREVKNLLPDVLPPVRDIDPGEIVGPANPFLPPAARELEGPQRITTPQVGERRVGDELNPTAVDGNANPTAQELVGPQRIEAPRTSPRETGRGDITNPEAQRRIQLFRDQPFRERAAPTKGLPPGTIAQVLSESAPSFSRAILEQALSDNSVASRLGTTQTQVAEETIIPAAGSEPIRRSPSLINLDTFKTGDRDVIEELSSDPTFLKNVDVSEAITELQDKFKGDKSIHIDKSRLFRTDREVGIDYAISQESGVAFRTKEEAFEFASKRLNRLDYSGIEVLGFDPRTGKYVAGADGTEYILHARYSKLLAGIADDSRVFKNDDLVNLGFLNLVNNLDTTVNYVEDLARAVTRVDIRADLISREFSDILKDLNTLGHNRTNAVYRILKQEEQARARYSNRQLDELVGGDQAIINGIKAVRNFNDRVWSARNTLYYEHMKKNDYISTKLNDGSVVPVKRTPTRADKDELVWWDEGGEFVTKGALDDKGVSVVLYRQHFPRKNANGTQESRILALSKSHSDFRPLPSVVLHKVDGYLGRNFTGRYLLKKKGSSLTVKFADNIADATDYARSRPDLEIHEARHLRDNLDFSSRIDSEIDDLSDLGLLTHTKRRENLADLDLSYQRNLASPEQSILAMQRGLSQTLGLDQVIDQSLAKWNRLYGNKVNTSDSKGQFTWNGEIGIKGSGPRAEALAKEAEIYRDKIKLIAGMDEAAIDKGVSSAGRALAKWLAGGSVNFAKRGAIAKSLRGLSRVADSASDGALTKGLKGWSHNLWISLNPSRQLMMQASSMVLYAGYRHASTYFGKGAATLDAMFLAQMKMAERYGDEALDAVIEGAAKAGKEGEEGVKTAKELRELWEDYRASGILETVNSHQFQEAMFRKSTGWRQHEGNTAGAGPSIAGGATRFLHDGVARNTVDISNKFGFQLGESIARTYAFLAVRNAKKVDGDYVPNSGIELGVDASQLAGNMGAANRSQFQTGSLSPLFQFQSHGIKMMQFMMLNTKATKHFSTDIVDNPTKIRMLLWNSLMFGGEGIGLGRGATQLYRGYINEEAQQRGIEPEEAVEEVLVRGLAGWMFDASIEALTGTDVDTSISGTVSPLGSVFNDFGLVGATFADGDRPTNPGTMAAKMVYDLFSDAPFDPFDYLGPGGGLYQTGRRSFDNMRRILIAPGFEPREKGEELVLEALRIIPQFNNAFQARLMGNMGQYVDNYGTPVVQATFGEAMAKALTGNNPDSISRYHDLRKRYQNSFRFVPATERELKSTGNDLASAFHEMVKRRQDGLVTYDDFVKRLESYTNLARMNYPEPGEYAVVMSNFNRAMVRLQNNTTGQTAVQELIDAIETDQDLMAAKGIDGVIELVSQFNTPYARLTQELLQKTKREEIDGL